MPDALAVQADGRQVKTTGVAHDGALDPLQRAFIAEDAFQCGFCTPGQIMAMRGLLRRNAHPTHDEVRHATDGNVCRCGAYLRIQSAALEVAKAVETARKRSPAPRAGAPGARADTERVLLSEI